MANNPDGKYETYHEVPGSKYFFISGPTGVAVHKNFFKWWSLFLVGFTSVSTTLLCLTNYWQLLLTATFNLLFVKVWYIGWPTLFITITVTYLWYSHRSKKRMKEQVEQQRRRAVEDAQISLSKGVNQQK